MTSTTPLSESPIGIVKASLAESPLLAPCGGEMPACEPLPGSGSSRRYFRFEVGRCGEGVSASEGAGANTGASGGHGVGRGQTFLGVYHTDLNENAAYLDFSRQFLEKGLPVPQVLWQDAKRNVYFVENVGEQTLYEWRQSRKAENAVLKTLYRRVIDHLIDFQYIGGKDFNYAAAYPYQAFDEKAIYADLLYFKYYFLKLSDTAFDERALEADFQALTAYLAAAPREVFMCRDFQSRNIMLDCRREDDKSDDLEAFAARVPLYFIDFQGGRRGPAAYDLATLLYEAKADLSPELRENLLRYYMERTAARYPYTAERNFEADFYGFVLLRIFQAMGAYGLRGLYERKAVFLQSIPHAISNLGRLLDEGRFPVEMPEVARIIAGLRRSPWAATSGATRTTAAFGADTTATSATASLTISVLSFSFRQGLPQDPSGNGGGFVFDCRGLPNPGREAAYATLTGRDAEVQAYLRRYEQTERFITACMEATAFNIDNYLQRGFSHLQVAFGCTGGQHRSVYCAEEYARLVQSRYPNVKVELRHVVHPA